ncbi:hypothetical protein DERP_005495 [Dermatophagoides pteronyssinus]|uniref:Uncharacterized protein n=1 Tax=Dermatophagoides pteronyssinus TaxID=6956 RepID=A0ABQ8JNI4_DERPT|nr:hypothetical protein DERP_005495 [Dermatophagoides pteronyssinus]
MDDESESKEEEKSKSYYDHIDVDITSITDDAFASIENYYIILKEILYFIKMPVGSQSRRASIYLATGNIVTTKMDDNNDGGNRKSATTTSHQ